MSCQRPLAIAFLLTACLAGAPHAVAAERDFCANRPGLNTPACTLEPGAVMIETGIMQWDHTADLATIDDTITLGDTTVRVGIADRAELQLGFVPYVRDRLRDAMSGSVSTGDGAGDVTLALRRGIAGANGPFAIQPFVTLPVGKAPGGAGDWGAGVIVPMGFNLPAGFQLAVSPEIDAATNSGGSGRHLAFGSAVGLSHALGKTLSLAVEANAFRDNDPSGHETRMLAAVSLAWQPVPGFQLDIEVDAGLRGGVPGRTLSIGFAKRLR